MADVWFATRTVTGKSGVPVDLRSNESDFAQAIATFNGNPDAAAAT